MEAAATMDFFWKTPRDGDDHGENANREATTTSAGPPNRTAATFAITNQGKASSSNTLNSTNRSVRSIASQSSAATLSQGSVHWTKNRRRPGRGAAENQEETTMVEEEEEMVICADGFVNGDFRSGKVLDLHLESKCWVTACAGSLLAVGTATALQFYDTNNNVVALVHQVPVDSQISALKWILPALPPNQETTTAIRKSIPEKVQAASDDDTDPNASSESSGIFHSNNNNNNERKLLAVARLDGHLCLYDVDGNILETQGPTLLYWSATTRQQIRCLDAGYLRIAAAAGHDHHTDYLLLVAGDKQGSMTVTRFAVNVNDPPRLIREEAMHSSTRQAVLGLVLDTRRHWLVTTDRGGCVQVHHLVRHLLADPNNSTNNNRHNRDLLEPLWSTHRSGAVQCATFAPTLDETANQNNSHPLLAFGGYDKTVVLVDTKEWLVVRELSLQGTINTIEFDPRGRYVGVGCRDKTFTVFDTSTYVAIKVIHTPNWVTSVSWFQDESDKVAIRSETNCVSILDLAPIQLCTNLSLSSSGDGASSSSCSLSWSRTGQYLARADGSTVAIADAAADFCHVASFDAGRNKIVTQVAFCQAVEKDDCVAAITEQGQLLVLRMRFLSTGVVLEPLRSVDTEANLNSLAWSPDGELLVTGGKQKNLHVYTSNDLQQKREALAFKGRIWDFDFFPSTAVFPVEKGAEVPWLAVALGDYTTVLLDATFEPVMQVSRSRTCRCLRFHPTLPLLVIGDGAETIAIVDYVEGELIMELEVEGRVNDLEFSPSGDYLLAGTDASRFLMYETSTFRPVQEFPCTGFALAASFSPSGKCLVLGSADASYKIVNLGPFLGTDLIPLGHEDELRNLPSWAQNEALYRSGNGPSLFQRLMSRNSSDNLRFIADIFREHPSVIYTYDRESGEDCFETVLRVQKPALLKLALMNLVNGTLDPAGDREKTFLNTSIPQKCRDALPDIIENYPPDFIVDILNSMTFMKVPNTSAFSVTSGNRFECGSSSFTDPWSKPQIGGHKLDEAPTSAKLVTKGGTLRSPAVLPLPGLGEMNFLSYLLKHAPQQAFDNQALAVVLRVLWYTHIRKYYYLDCCLFLMFYISWVILVETVEDSKSTTDQVDTPRSLVCTVVAFNILFNTKELVEGRYGRRPAYWRSLWNIFDVLSLLCVYSYTGVILFLGDSWLPLAVLTTLLLTVKLLSYLRGFSDTSWLISVLAANFRDVRGFLIILSAIMAGFSVAFRILFGATGDETFGSLRRSFLSTFEMTITGSYDPGLLFESPYPVLAVITFTLAITCILIIVLNALISVLADSYARVQESAVGNRRREMASLIVEYLSLLTPRKRREIERKTTWFHTLLEVDADGSLQLQTEDWRGGLNALRRDMQELSSDTKESYEKALNHLKSDLNSDMDAFKKEVVSMLEDLVEDVKYLRKAQSEGMIKFDGSNVKKAVRAVRSVGMKGSALFRPLHGANNSKLQINSGE